MAERRKCWKGNGRMGTLMPLACAVALVSAGCRCVETTPPQPAPGSDEAIVIDLLENSYCNYDRDAEKYFLPQVTLLSEREALRVVDDYFSRVKPITDEDGAVVAKTCFNYPSYIDWMRGMIRDGFAGVFRILQPKGERVGVQAFAFVKFYPSPIFLNSPTSYGYDLVEIHRPGLGAYDESDYLLPGSALGLSVSDYGEYTRPVDLVGEGDAGEEGN